MNPRPLCACGTPAVCSLTLDGSAEYCLRWPRCGPLTVGSLFSGIGGIDLACEQAGMRVVYHVENDTACNKVLAHHWPEVKRYGDIRTTSGLPRVDVIAFGSPCQGLSVAGKRRGLGDDRSGLFLEAIRIIRECPPRFVVWENVFGALSSTAGRDFATVLDALAESGAMDVAWRVLDAQFFGVPQRRRRVFVIADFGGECAGEVLFEPTGVCRYPPARRGAGEGVARTLRGGSAGSRGHGKQNGSDRMTFVTELARPFVGGTRLDGESETFVVFDTAQSGHAPTIAQPLRANRWGGSDSHGDEGNVVMAWTSSPGSNAAAWESEVYPTLNATPPGDTAGLQYGIRQGMAVRRLTPLECERLMGLPDGYLDGLALSDGAKYRMLGNSVAVPCVAWIMRRLVESAHAR